MAANQFFKNAAVAGTFGSLILSPSASAHCPLCTIGAGAAAMGAAYLGMRYGAIGVFIGAFAAALGLWLAPMVRRQLIPHQRKVIFWLIYLSTLLPLVPLFDSYKGFYLNYGGAYGSWSNQTYIVNLFLVGAVIGTGVIFLAPKLSRKLSKLRNGSLIPYQGIAITLGLLAISGAVMQMVR